MAILDPTSQDPGGAGALRCHRGPTEGRSHPHLAAAGAGAAARAQGWELKGRSPATSPSEVGTEGTPVCVRLCRGTHHPGTGAQFRTRGRGAESLTDLGHLPAPLGIWITRHPSSAAEPREPASSSAGKPPAEPGSIGSTHRAFPGAGAAESALRGAERPHPPQFEDMVWTTESGPSHESFLVLITYFGYIRF